MLILFDSGFSRRSPTLRRARSHQRQKLSLKDQSLKRLKGLGKNRCFFKIKTASMFVSLLTNMWNVSLKNLNSLVVFDSNSQVSCWISNSRQGFFPKRDVKLQPHSGWSFFIGIYIYSKKSLSTYILMGFLSRKHPIDKQVCVDLATGGCIFCRFLLQGRISLQQFIPSVEVWWCCWFLKLVYQKLDHWPPCI